MKNLALFTIVLVAFSLFNCNSDNNVPIVNQADSARYTSVLTDLSRNVITETYLALNNNALTLKAAADAFSIGQEVELESVKTAWRNTRSYWEKSEAFNYGPSDAYAADAAMDTWPVDEDALQGLLDYPEPITADTLAANNEIRGFHLIERLVWGQDGAKTAAEFTPKEVELLQAAAQDLQNITQLLYDGWRLEGGNYGANFINAGQSGSVYTAQELALEAILNGMILLADEVASIKIQGPLIQGAIAEESKISNNTLADLRNNIMSIRHLYTGERDSIESNGIQSLMGSNSTLDDEILNAIDQTLAATDAIPGTFNQALTNNPEAVENAYNKAASLHALLQNELLPYLAGNQ